MLLGLTVPQLGGSVRLGAGPAVAEADEADGSIARIVGNLSVVTNLSFDHPQYRRPLRRTFAALAKHVAAVPSGGRVILGSGRSAHSLEASARASVWRLGRDFDARTLQRTAEWTQIQFADPGGGTVVGSSRLQAVYLDENAALAYAALRAFGYPPEAAAHALSALTALARRFQTLGSAGGVTVVDDFGKHPTCIRATLAALRRCRPRRLHAVYEPHRYDHVARWGRWLAGALGGADHVVVLPVNDHDFVARHAPPPDWFRRFGLHGELARDRADALQRVRHQCRSGDIVCVFGVHDHLAHLARALLVALNGSASIPP
jgi:UDP-N-acetylmuramate--alanine ligase